ncbi:hypothetical protein GC088_03395 [Arthrobacter sp. JZ12]|uniref:hypothetical protein n=1 Tax=Arthrobacter sp. JZ12 TaxID=2654190 RepID=UPI002B4A99E6|nr:hypothetical protein [Arthrobacter sp. JZ12]WRH24232.1 hypothetical protein GC088_03395 [Arthrobacter sp. JZ12]
MAARDDGKNVPIRVEVVPGSPADAAGRIPAEPTDERSPLTDAGSFDVDDDTPRYRDATALIAGGAAGATFVGVAVDPAGDNSPGLPDVGSFDGADGGE